MQAAHSVYGRFRSGALVALLLVVAWPGIVQAAPLLTRVEPTPDGYALIGNGFGTDRSKVQVFEGNTAVAASAIVTRTITLDAPATPNFKVGLRSASTSVIVRSTVTVSPGATTATFTVSAASKASADQPTIEAERSVSGKATANLTIKK